MSRRRKILELNLELFTDLFNIPENGRVVAAYPNAARNTLEFVLESEAFDENPEGGYAPKTYPIFSRLDAHEVLWWRIVVEPDATPLSRLDFVADEEE